jgi:alkanesulfonate monooxygenase SsuD/methylene tetrahydromethanopterin reductase-like flavin-dependent oxidoreductase (luciferase family)
MPPATVRFEVLCLPNVPWDVLVERVSRVEGLGFEAVALPDHFVDWTNPPSPWFEGWTALTGLAGTTSTIRLATCVTQIPFRNPAVFARQAVTLDHISGGRLEIGLGTGLIGDPSYAMAGIDDWGPRERVERLAEYAEIVDRMLRDEVTTFAGAHYRADGAIVNPRPVQHPRPPLTIGALGPVMLRHVARRADTWSTLSFTASFEDQIAETRERVAAMDEACTAVGRDPASLGRSYTMYDALARPRGGTYDCYESPGRFEDMAGRIIELGIHELVLYYPPDERQLPVFERIATDVLPRLRSGGMDRA